MLYLKMIAKFGELCIMFVVPLKDTKAFNQKKFSVLHPGVFHHYWLLLVWRRKKFLGSVRQKEEKELWKNMEEIKIKAVQTRYLFFIVLIVPDWRVKVFSNKDSISQWYSDKSSGFFTPLCHWSKKERKKREKEKNRKSGQKEKLKKERCWKK